MKIKEFIDKNVETLPPRLADIIVNEQSIWTNDACYGYTIVAMRNAGYDEDKITELMRYLHSAFEEYSVEEAEQEWIVF